MSTRVEPSAVREARGLPLYLWGALALFTASLLALLHVRTEIIRLGYALEQERQVSERLRAEHDRLALERTVLGSSERLAARARELGMRPATPDDLEPVSLDGAAR